MAELYTVVLVAGGTTAEGEGPEKDTVVTPQGSSSAPVMVLAVLEVLLTA